MGEQTAHEGRIADLLARSEADWDAIEDATVTVYSLKVGHTLTQADVDAISLYDKTKRDDEESSLSAYERGLADGRREAGGKVLAEALEKIDELRVERMTERALSRFYRQTDRASAALRSAREWVRLWEVDRQHGLVPTEKSLADALAELDAALAKVAAESPASHAAEREE